MINSTTRFVLKFAGLGLGSLLTFVLCMQGTWTGARATPSQTTATPDVPDWALPSSATHKQYPPPADFHRPSKNFDTPIGIFQGQSDIGGPLVPGSASYDAATKKRVGKECRSRWSP